MAENDRIEVLTAAKLWPPMMESLRGAYTVHDRTHQSDAAAFAAAAPPVGVALRTTHIHVKAYHGREVLTAQLFFPDALIDGLYADSEPYKSHTLLTAPGLDRSYPRIRNGEDVFFNSSRSTPMAVERVNGVLTAKATIGVIGADSRPFRTLFR